MSEAEMSHFVFKDISTNSGVQRIYFLLNNINQVLWLTGKS